VGLSRVESKEMVQAFFDELIVALQGGDCMKLAGFGSLMLGDNPSRPGAQSNDR